MKKFLLLLVLFASFLMVSCGEKDSAINIPKTVLYEQNPIVFAKSFIAHVRGTHNKRLYSRFLYSEQRDSLDREDAIALVKFSNAFVENDLLFTVIDELEMELTSQEGNSVLVTYTLPKPIALSDVYTHLSSKTQNWICKKGQITLKKDNERWGVAEHWLVGEEPTSMQK